MRYDILIHDKKDETKPLAEAPQKDGTHTWYACGLVVSGSWAGRIEEHERFRKTLMGRYILDKEQRNADLLEAIRSWKQSDEKQKSLNAELLDVLKKCHTMLVASGIELKIVDTVEETIAKAEGKIKTYEYSISTPSLWASFDHGEVEAVSYEEARLLALERLREDFKKANDALGHADITFGFDINFSEGDVQIKEKDNG